LLQVGRAYLCFLYHHLAVGRWAAQTDGRKQAGGAIWPDVEVEADLNVLAGWPLERAFNGRRLSRGERGQSAKKGDGRAVEGSRRYTIGKRIGAGSVAGVPGRVRATKEPAERAQRPGANLLKE